MLAQLIHIAVDPDAFALQEIAHRAGEATVAQPVRRLRLDWQEPAEKLVLALRTALEYFEPPGNRVLDRLVIAAFEVQQRQRAQRSPVAAVERGRIAEEERGRERLAIAARDQQRRALRQRIPDAQEEIQVQVGA